MFAALAVVLCYCLQDALLSAEINSKVVKRHNQQVSQPCYGLLHQKWLNYESFLCVKSYNASAWQQPEWQQPEARSYDARHYACSQFNRFASLFDSIFELFSHDRPIFVFGEKCVRVRVRITLIARHALWTLCPRPLNPLIPTRMTQSFRKVFKAYQFECCHEYQTVLVCVPFPF